MRIGAGGGADSYRGYFQDSGKGTRGKGRARLVSGADDPGRVVLPNRMGVQPAYSGSIPYSVSIPVGNHVAGAVDRARYLLAVNDRARRRDLCSLYRRPLPSSG